MGVACQVTRDRVANVLVNATSESTHMIEEEAEGILKAFAAGDAFTFERQYRDPLHAVPTA